MKFFRGSRLATLTNEVSVDIESTKAKKGKGKELYSVGEINKGGKSTTKKINRNQSMKKIHASR